MEEWAADRFSEVVQAGTGNIVISNGSDTRNVSVNDTTQVKFNGGRVNITLTTPLQDSSRYTVKLAGGVITDWAGPGENRTRGNA